MKTLVVGLTALLIAVECFAGPGFTRLAKKIEFAAKHSSLYKPQTQTLRNAMANKEAPTLGQPVPEPGLEYKADRSNFFTAAETEAKRFLFDPAAARAALKPMEKEDPKLANAIFRDLRIMQRNSAALRLGGFTPAEIKYTLKEGAPALPRQTDQERQGVAKISKDLVQKAVKELPDQFFDRPTKPPFDTGMQKVVDEHKPEMGERITYDSSSSQLEFKFDSPQVSLNQASVDLGQRFDRYREMIIQKKPDFAIPADASVTP